MAADLDRTAILTAFDVPRSDGAFEGATLSYLRQLGARRPFVMLAFAPKAAGTFFREAAIEAIGGHLFRAVHAQGGRDATLYLPSFITAFLDKDHTRPVAHVHMQALISNRHFIDAFDLKPVIMIRNIPDMLASYWDMLEKDVVARHDGLNCRIPSDFLDMSHAEKADFMVDIMGPWYASYFASWKTYAEAAPGRVLVLRYADFCADPATALHATLTHSGHQVSRDRCEAALDKVWRNKEQFRFNKGVVGRGREYFTTGQIKGLSRQLSYYKSLRSWVPELLGESAIISLHAGKAVA
jgi:hypothetical protein